MCFDYQNQFNNDRIVGEYIVSSEYVIELFAIIYRYQKVGIESIGSLCRVGPDF